MSENKFVSKQFVLKLTVFGVFANGLIIILTSLYNDIVTRAGIRESNFTLGLPLVFGITFIYLATLLRRRKRVAWAIAVPLYIFLISYNIANHLLMPHSRYLIPLGLIRSVLLPAIVIFGLAYYHDDFNVKSDVRSFAVSLRTIIIVLLITLAYGIVGFQLLDIRDFHEEISIGESIHRTVDQFDFTTDKALTPYTHRARLFLDSLSLVSSVSVIYVAVSLFQPIRARFSDQAAGREKMKELLENHLATSEDFFKLWPHDKSYFFDNAMQAGLAFHVQRGVAMTVGDPAGSQKHFSSLLDSFGELCYVNDWLPALIHTDPKFSNVYKKHGFSQQKIGEEAIVNLQHFAEDVSTNKYFRHIKNKFVKGGYVAEMLHPPHNDAIIKRLKEVSDDWIKLPGRAERGMMMGYFSPEYLQQCSVMVVRDAAGTIQAFINQIPSFDPEEANYDMLRHTKDSMSNINDFLLVNFIETIQNDGFKRLNIGLCPLAGMEDIGEEATVVDNILQFVYSNGDRFYSFSGLHKFKAKYEPEWSDRYIVHKGGIRGLSRTLYALNKAMSHTK